MAKPTITVLGSVNLDLVASVDRLPVAGETVTGATLNKYPGGKGANQALAARRLGANVSLVASHGIASHRSISSECQTSRICGTNASSCTVAFLICFLN